MPGFQIEPSQGTHFFQNITSLGVGYLSVDTVAGDGSVDFETIGGLECARQMKHCRVLRTPGEITAFIDRSSNRAVAGLRE